MTRYEFTQQQWLFPGFRKKGSFLWWSWPGWNEPKVTPLPATRGVHRTPVDPNLVAPVDTPLPEKNLGLAYSKGGIRLPRPYKQGLERSPGTPYQLADSSKGTIPIRVINTVHGIDYVAQYPKPVDNYGQLWIESNPTPNYVMAGSNHYDRHLFMYDIATDTYHEAIGFAFGNVNSHGVFDRDGNLIDGWRPVVAAKEAVGPYLFDPDTDIPHSLSLSVAGRDEAEPTWPWLGRKMTFSEEGKAKIPEFEEGSVEKLFVDCVTQYPIIVGDHGGHNNFRVRAGSERLKSVDWQGWQPNLEDLVPCDGITGP